MALRPVDDLQTRGPRFLPAGPGCGNGTSVTSTNAVSYAEVLNPGLIAGRHRQPQHQVSVGFQHAERQTSLTSGGELLPRVARYLPPVFVGTRAAEGECHPGEGPADIDPGRTG